jgi:hypothetical protein
MERGGHPVATGRTSPGPRTRRLLIASVNEFGDPLDNATSLVYVNGCLYNTQLGFFKQ